MPNLRSISPGGLEFSLDQLGRFELLTELPEFMSCCKVNGNHAVLRCQTRCDEICQSAPTTAIMRAEASGMSTCDRDACGLSCDRWGAQERTAGSEGCPETSLNRESIANFVTTIERPGLGELRRTSCDGFENVDRVVVL